MRYVLGIDFGGGASKATLLAEDGTVQGVHTVEYSTQFPLPGWVEQDPEAWVQAARENMQVLLQKTGIPASSIAAVSLDGATHTAVLLDEDKAVLRPAIYWTDTRCQQEVIDLKREHGALIWEKALHQVDTIWTLPQLLWVKTHEPQIFSHIRHILFAKDYVRLRLTGVLGTDVIEAQGSMLFDCFTSSWSPELCALVDLDPALLPPVHKPQDIAGTVTPAAARACGLAPGTPVLWGSTDTVMEVFASGAVEKGNMTIKLATAGRICVITDHPCPDKQLINYAHLVEGLWYPGTATKACAASYRWYRDTFGDDYASLDQGAASVPPGCDGLFYHPYLNGELTPYGDPQLRGSFTGIRSSHTKAHFSRAVLEGVGYSLLACMQVLEETGIPKDNTATIIGGGAASPLWRQILSDMLHITLRQAENSDSSLGSAMLAGISAGLFISPADAVHKCTRYLSLTQPNPENHALYAKMYPVYTAIHDALAPVYHLL